MRQLLILLCMVATWASSAHAYGPTGHRVIAELASLHLTPEARAAVIAILGDEFMAEAATMPDEMRSSPDEFWQKEAGVLPLYQRASRPDI